MILKLYEDASSSKINFSKSQALWARSYKNRIDHEIMKISIKILGVNFGNPILNNYKSDKISEVLAKEIHVWNRARLSLRGKNIINNTNRGTYTKKEYTIVYGTGKNTSSQAPSSSLHLDEWTRLFRHRDKIKISGFKMDLKVV